jgi:aspartyl-tRNA(Asn)/glutamyl-tRNA(Gln) amidotransferase subunit B
VRASLPEKPSIRCERLRPAWSFTDLEFQDVVNAGLLVEVEQMVAEGAMAQSARNWWMGEIARIANERGVDAAALVSPKDVSELIALVESGELTDRLARQVLLGTIDGEGSPTHVVEARGLKVVSDDGALIAAIDEAPAAQPDVLEKIREGKVQAAGAVIGAVMKAMHGTADAARVRELVLEPASH